MGERGGPWVTVFQTLNLPQLKVAQSLLESGGIRSRTLDDTMGQIFPVAMSGFGRIQVQESEARQAKEMLSTLAP